MSLKSKLILSTMVGALALTASSCGPAIKNQNSTPIAISNENNPFIMPMRNINYDLCFSDAFEPVPINNYKVTVKEFSQKNFAVYPLSDDSFIKSVTTLKAETPENIEQYFIFPGIKDFSLDKRIEFDYWRFREGFQLNTLYLGCLLGNVPRYSDSLYGEPFLSERENGSFDGLIQLNSLRYIEQGE
jgi:hypothetical protein